MVPIYLRIHVISKYSLITYILLLPIIFSLRTEFKADAISCFTCSSRNRNDMTCEDPFNASSHSYVEKCLVPKKGRDGLFPAHYCIKVFGTRVINSTTKETLIVRKCALIDMYNQCGPFLLDHERYESGCILTCDHDGCNSSNNKYPNGVLCIFMPILITLIALAFYYT